jgi:hypothetical protein
MPDNPIPSTVTFHYVKSNYFRMVHANGVFGGINPDGSLLVTVFSERAPLPDITVQKVESNGQVGAEIMEQRKASSGIVREMEVGLIMDIRTARIVSDWLKERIAFADKMVADMQPKAEVIANTQPKAEVKQ